MIISLVTGFAIGVVALVATLVAGHGWWLAILAYSAAGAIGIAGCALALTYRSRLVAHRSVEFVKSEAKD